MNLTQHVALTGVAAAALLPFRGADEIILFAAGSILIDVDHYLLFVQRRKSFDIGGMFRYFDDLDARKGEVPYAGLCLFHTVDFFLIVALLAWMHPPIFPLLAGLLFHFCLDLIHLYRSNTIFIRAYFLMEHAIRRRNPGYPYC